MLCGNSRVLLLEADHQHGRIERDRIGVDGQRALVRLHPAAGVGHEFQDLNRVDLPRHRCLMLRRIYLDLTDSEETRAEFCDGCRRRWDVLWIDLRRPLRQHCHETCHGDHHDDHHPRVQHRLQYNV